MAHSSEKDCAIVWDVRVLATTMSQPCYHSSGRSGDLLILRIVIHSDYNVSCLSVLCSWNAGVHV